MANNEIYHVINRGVARNPIFIDKRDYQRFINLVNFYRFENLPMRYSHFNRLNEQEKIAFLNKINQNKNLVNIISFCLMPNHIHFLLQQLSDKGISVFMKNLQNSYARYFNIKLNRTGPLFESMFKAVRIESEEQLLHVNRYIHLNPVSSYLIEKENLAGYPWSSLSNFLGQKFLPFIKGDIILNHFKNLSYQNFVFDQLDYQRKLQDIKHLVLE